jgi:heterodisulfide reductase subunit C
VKKILAEKMNDPSSRFGFVVSKDRQIDFDGNEREILRKVATAEPSIAICISCGTCAATCASARFTDFSLRKVILLVKRGETMELAKETNKCMLCGKCQLACPRGVNTRNLIIQINRALQSESL